LEGTIADTRRLVIGNSKVLESQKIVGSALWAAMGEAAPTRRHARFAKRAP